MADQLQLQIDEPGGAAHQWQEALALAEARLGREAVESWLRDTTPLTREAGRLVLAAPNATARTWIEKKYSRALEQILLELHGERLELEVVVGRPASRPTRAAARRVAPPAAIPARAPVPSIFAPIPLNEKYTFDSFVTGQSNRFAHAAASAVAEQPGRDFNPLFIYGGVGLGKTHLLQGIGHALLRRNPLTRVAYVSGETFTSHFITSLREHREEEFRRAYRSVDIWLVDDIHFIADKSSTKEEFFHTFNELYLTNRQIVLASDRPPRELRLMEDRLRTRLESGLMAEIQPPELETRLAILQRRAGLEGADVPLEVLYQLAHSVTESVRVLEAVLVRMLALASLNRCAVTPELAARAVAAFVRESALPTVDVLAIQREVCETFQVSAEALTGTRRDRHTSTARQVAMYLIRELTRKPLTELGELFGGKSHSTVLYSCNRLAERLKEDPALEATVRELRGRLTSGARSA